MTDPVPDAYDGSAVRGTATVRRLMLLGMAVAAAMLALGATALIDARGDVMHQADQSGSNLAGALARDIARNVDTFDLSVQGAIGALAIPGIGDVSHDLRQTALFDRAATAEFLGSILVLDPEGRILASSTPMTPASAAIRLADRDYFEVHRARDDAGLFVSRPYESRLRAGDPSIAISRRVDGPNGSFGGVVMGAMRLAYFQHLFDALDLGPHGTVALLRNDGVLLWRRPGSPSYIGRDFTISSSGRRMDGVSGRYRDRSAIDGVERVFAYRRIEGLPLTLVVGQATEDIYAAWWRKALVIGAVLLVLSVSVAGLCLLFRKEMQRRLQVQAALMEAAARLRVMATTDSLTGLANRRAFEAELQSEWKRAARSGTEIALLMLDADKFKAYNDLYGHPAGDTVLQRVSDCIRSNTRRPTDLAARIGGEEFVALLPQTDLAGAVVIAERIRAMLHDLAIPHAGSEGGRVTLSIGVAAAYPGDGGEESRLLKQADTAMYLAKQSGRDCVRMPEGVT